MSGTRNTRRRLKKDEYIVPAYDWIVQHFMDKYWKGRELSLKNRKIDHSSKFDK